MRKKVNMGTNSYKVSVVLLEFEEQIKRTLLINDNVKISDFCEAIIISMNGDLSHRYELKYKNNLILIPGKELEATEYILRIGYYKYEEIFNGNYDFHSIAYKLVKDNDLYTVKDYP